MSEELHPGFSAKEVQGLDDLRKMVYRWGELQGLIEDYDEEMIHLEGQIRRVGPNWINHVGLSEIAMLVITGMRLAGAWRESNRVRSLKPYQRNAKEKKIMAKRKDLKEMIKRALNKFWSGVHEQLASFPMQYVDPYHNAGRDPDEGEIEELEETEEEEEDVSLIPPKIAKMSRLRVVDESPPRAMSKKGSSTKPAPARVSTTSQPTAVPESKIEMKKSSGSSKLVSLAKGTTALLDEDLEELADEIAEEKRIRAEKRRRDKKRYRGPIVPVEHFMSNYHEKDFNAPESRLLDRLLSAMCDILYKDPTREADLLREWSVEIVHRPSNLRVRALIFLPDLKPGMENMKHRYPDLRLRDDELGSADEEIADTADITFTDRVPPPSSPSLNELGSVPPAPGSFTPQTWLPPVFPGTGASTPVQMPLAPIAAPRRVTPASPRAQVQYQGPRFDSAAPWETDQSTLVSGRYRVANVPKGASPLNPSFSFTPAVVAPHTPVASAPRAMVDPNRAVSPNTLRARHGLAPLPPAESTSARPAGSIDWSSLRLSQAEYDANFGGQFGSFGQSWLHRQAEESFSAPLRPPIPVQRDRQQVSSSGSSSQTPGRGPKSSGKASDSQRSSHSGVRKNSPGGQPSKKDR